MKHFPAEAAFFFLSSGRAKGCAFGRRSSRAMPALRALWLLFALALPVSAQQPAEAPLTEREAKVVALSRGNEAFSRYWLGYVRRVVVASEDFRRAGLLRRCEPVRKHPARFLDPAMREAIEQVAANRQRLVERFAGAAFTRWQHGAALLALEQMPPAQADALLAGVGTPAFDDALAFLGHAAVLDDFAVKSVDVGTGIDEPAASIWLKTYFEQAGAAELLRSALQAARPALLKDFDRLGAVAQHEQADAGWLRALTAAMADAAPSLAEAIVARMPASAVPAHERLHGFYVRVLQLTQKLPFSVTLGASAPSLPPSAAEQRFPVPPGFNDALFQAGPTQLAGAQVARFCPG
jgi:hypothetical protein